MFSDSFLVVFYSFSVRFLLTVNVSVPDFRYCCPCVTQRARKHIDCHSVLDVAPVVEDESESDTSSDVFMCHSFACCAIDLDSESETDEWHDCIS